MCCVGVGLFVSCRVLCCSCCVFVCVTCFSFLIGPTTREDEAREPTPCLGVAFSPCGGAVAIAQRHLLEGAVKSKFDLQTRLLTAAILTPAAVPVPHPLAHRTPTLDRLAATRPAGAPLWGLGFGLSALDAAARAAVLGELEAQVAEDVSGGTGGGEGGGCEGGGGDGGGGEGGGGEGGGCEGGGDEGGGGGGEGGGLYTTVAQVGDTGGEHRWDIPEGKEQQQQHEQQQQQKQQQKQKQQQQQEQHEQQQQQLRRLQALYAMSLELRRVLGPDVAPFISAGLSLSERCCQRLLRIQARGVINSSPGVPSAAALHAADYIFASLLGGGGMAALVAASQGGLTQPGGVGGADGDGGGEGGGDGGGGDGRDDGGGDGAGDAADAEEVVRCYRQAQCPQGAAALSAARQAHISGLNSAAATDAFGAVFAPQRDAALSAASQAHTSGPTATTDASGSVLAPQRDACLLCASPVCVSPGFVSGHKCAAGHTSGRCWFCFHVLPLASWRCRSCGGGSCRSHDAQPPALLGPLRAMSPPGICGLCGTRREGGSSRAFGA